MARLLIMIACLAGGIVHAQGISNARDGSGNLVERGAATRSYSTVPMANSTIRTSVVPQTYIIIAHPRVARIRVRR